MRHTRYFALIAATLVALINAPPLQAQSNCDALVADNGNVLSGADLRQVEAAARALVTKGADVRVRTEADLGGYSNVDYLEAAREKLGVEATMAGGGVRTLTREIGEAQTEQHRREETIRQLKTSTSPNRGVAMRTEATKVAELEEQLRVDQSALETQKKLSAELDDVLRKIDQKHDMLVVQLHAIETDDASAKAEHHAAAALTEAGKLSSVGAGASVDGIQRRVRARKDVADEELSRAMASTDGLGEDAESAAAADAVLARLGVETATSSASATK